MSCRGQKQTLVCMARGTTCATWCHFHAEEKTIARLPKPETISCFCLQKLTLGYVLPKSERTRRPVIIVTCHR